MEKDDQLRGKFEEIKHHMRRDDASVEDLARFLHEIGARRLADQIWETHIQVRLGRELRDLDYYELTLAIHELKEDRLLDDVMKIQAQHVEQSVKYNNVVATLGYAGFVGLLSLAKGMAYPDDYKYTWFMLTISLVAFVLWNVAVSVLVTITSTRLAGLFDFGDVFDRRDILEKFQGAQRLREKKMAGLNRFWLPIFTFSLTAALLAVGVLLVSILRLSEHEGSVVQYIQPIL